MGINGRCISAVNAPISAVLKSGITILKGAELRFTGIQFIVVFGVQTIFIYYILCVYIDFSLRCKLK